MKINNKLTRFVFTAYKAIGMILYPFMGPFLRIRAGKGKEDRERRYERYGYPSADKPSGPIIWFHAASVGEANAVIPVIEHVNSLGIYTIMTTGTVTSAEIVKKRLPRESYHQYVPLDLKPALGRFLDHWQPDVAIFTESEIWPMTMMELSNRKVPTILVNARMSDKSYKRWQNATDFAGVLFENFSHVIAQSATDAERFKSLGARPVDISGNLKVDTDSLPYDQREFDYIKKSIGTRYCWVAVSTHEGEEETIGRVHQRLKEKYPELLTIIVPRHPERGAGVTALLKETGLNVTTRSIRENISSATDIYMGDTIGEMGLYLRLASVCFMGKSLNASGGQNPLEPAMTGTAIVSGQNVQNFRDTYRGLLKTGAVRLISDEKMLAANIEYLLMNSAEREKMIVAARESVQQMSGALDNTIHILDSYLFPLTIKRNLEGQG